MCTEAHFNNKRFIILNIKLIELQQQDSLLAYVGYDTILEGSFIQSNKVNGCLALNLLGLTKQKHKEYLISNI